MEAHQISKIIQNELEDRFGFDWPEDWSEKIEECIVEPFTGSFFNPETQVFEDFWVIANLQPESLNDGYLVVYDVDTDLFGLAGKGDIFDDGSGELIGLYGTLAKALENV